MCWWFQECSGTIVCLTISGAELETRNMSRAWRLSPPPTATESSGRRLAINKNRKQISMFISQNVKYDNFLPINNNIESVGPDLSTFSGVMIYSRNRSIKYFWQKIPFDGNNVRQVIRPRQEQNKYFELFLTVLPLEFSVLQSKVMTTKVWRSSPHSWHWCLQSRCHRSKVKWLKVTLTMYCYCDSIMFKLFLQHRI